MFRVLWISGVLLSTAACGKSEAVLAYEQLADAVCKCTDEACAQKVSLDFKERLARYDKSGVQAKDAEAINKIAPKIRACAEKLIAAAPPPGPPTPIEPPK